MIGLVLPEHLAQQPVPLHVRLHDEDPAVAQGYAFVQQLVAAHGVELAGKLAGVEIDDLVALFEPVDLFKDRDRDDDVVLLEGVHAIVIVQDDVRIQNEDLVRS